MNPLAGLDSFARQYIRTALWAEMDESDENTGGEPLDRNYSVHDIASETLDEMADDCDRFQSLAADWIGNEEEQAGHDFWLTRNHHGAGFWDGDWPEPTGEQLTDLARSFGPYTLYLGDDGKIHGMKG